ncbi:potassium channel family protein [Leptospira sp. GIMC2001]|uniref:potassium channel family protein n=1 Tax=Leptospira sp. GIMC2001 TaxID=1513297 RepID=UPI00234A7DF7|nr:NAD-binding protein [Leptospira sp. GIMC2001]WCL50151.1 NAD-binding protein [Leptospira sp. GIMC2001]
MNKKRFNRGFFYDLRLQENIHKLSKFVLTLIAMVMIYSITFHFIMLWEGKQFSWITGTYWTLTTMSTLGFGDITFQSDVGKIFSLVVLLSGMIYLLVLFPYTFLTFFYNPLIEFQNKFRVQKTAPSGIQNHIIIVGLDSVAESFIEKLEYYGYKYLLMADTIQKAKDWKDMGFEVLHGYPDDPLAYERAAIGSAIMVFANAENEKLNTAIAFTAREINTEIEIVTNVQNLNFLDILYLAGCKSTIEITETLGKSFSKRCISRDHYIAEIGRFDQLVVWEVPVLGSELCGIKVSEAISKLKNLYLVGIWKRGKFILPELTDIIESNSILIVTGAEKDMTNINSLFEPEHFQNSKVLIIGCGRVGRATARHLDHLGVDYNILDNVPERKLKAISEGINIEDRFILGDASIADDLERAGLNKASTVIISTHEDSSNIFLTVYCRKLNENVLILSRANLERNVSTLHRAGADLVISYSSIGAMLLLNIIRKSNNIMLEEGLEIFRIPIPAALKLKTIAEMNIRKRTDCSIIALCQGHQLIESLPPIHEPLPAEGEIILIGSPLAEKNFMDTFADKK